MLSDGDQKIYDENDLKTHIRIITLLAKVDSKNRIDYI
jgi:hypothetical protein